MQYTAALLWRLYSFTALSLSKSLESTLIWLSYNWFLNQQLEVLCGRKTGEQERRPAEEEVHDGTVVRPWLVDMCICECSCPVRNWGKLREQHAGGKNIVDVPRDGNNWKLPISIRERINQWKACVPGPEGRGIIFIPIFNYAFIKGTGTRLSL